MWPWINFIHGSLDAYYVKDTWLGVLGEAKMRNLFSCLAPSVLSRFSPALSFLTYGETLTLRLWAWRSSCFSISILGNYSTSLNLSSVVCLMGIKTPVPEVIVRMIVKVLEGPSPEPCPWHLLLNMKCPSSSPPTFSQALSSFTSVLLSLFLPNSGFTVNLICI